MYTSHSNCSPLPCCTGLRYKKVASSTDPCTVEVHSHVQSFNTLDVGYSFDNIPHCHGNGCLFNDSGSHRHPMYFCAVVYTVKLWFIGNTQC